MNKQINLFKTCKEKKTQNFIDVFDFFEKVKNGEWQDIVLKIRCEKDKEKRTILKQTAPAVTGSGCFSERNIAGLIKHSGFIVMDFDDLEDVQLTKEYLSQDRYITALHTSISGNGLAAWVQIEPLRHKDAFDGLESYFIENYQLLPDKSCKDVSRLRFVSYDPDIYINKDAVEFKKYLKKKEKVPVTRDYVFTDSDLNFIVNQIKTRGIDITDSYLTWFRIGFALTNVSNGKEIFHAVSQNSTKYNYENTEKQYEKLRKATGHGITINTFFYYCKQAGIDITTAKTKKVISTAASHKKIGGNIENTRKVLKNIEGLEGADVEHVLKHVYETDKIESPELPLVEKIIMFLKTNYSLRRNVITRDILDGDKILQTPQLNQMFIDSMKVFDTEKRYNYSLMERCIMSNLPTDFNPLTDFFRENEHIKPKGLIRQLSECIQSDTGAETGNSDFIEYFLTRWLVGIVSSAHGIHSVLLLVLAGMQGTQKTRFFRELLPPEIKSYYSESRLDEGKDAYILMTKKLLICDEEYGGKSKQQEKTIKEMLSKQIFTLREPYGRISVDLQRLAVLCGTTNDFNILNDLTGNRRIIAFNIIDIDFEKYQKICKKSLFMEVYHLWKDGFQWMLTKDDIKLLNSNESDFVSIQSEVELFCKYFRIIDKYTSEIEYLTCSDIKKVIENNSGNKYISTTKIGLLMKKMKIERLKKRINGIVLNVYPLQKIENSFQPDEKILIHQSQNEESGEMPF